MFKITVYRKVSFSRNLLILLFLAGLVLVGAKIVLAHQKIATYEEAIKLYKAGDMIAAEAKFRQAKYNFAVTDHNDDINRKLAVLSPIRKMIEEIDQLAGKAKKADKLADLVEQYNKYQKHRKMWLAGTAVQKDMFTEMIKKTKMEGDFKSYFVAFENSLIQDLKGGDPDSSREEKINDSLYLIPARYFGGEQEKESTIFTAFIDYYTSTLNSMKGDGVVAPIAIEGARQLDMLDKFAFDPKSIIDYLDAYFLEQLKSSMEKEDVNLFATQAVSIQKLEDDTAAGLTVISYIDSKKAEIMAKAQGLLAKNKYEEAISIYQAIQPLEDTTALVASAELEWDKYEPIRVLKRNNPTIEFTHFVNGRNKFGVDSFVAAISSTGTLYFGTLQGQEPMKTQQTSLPTSTTINEMKFENQLSTMDNPVVLIDAKSTDRKHHYLAYEIIGGTTLENILNLDADGFTIEAPGRILVDNDDRQGAGELAYYSASSYNSSYSFDKIKKDYVEIYSDEIESYYGQKVGFTETIVANVPGGVIAEIASKYNYETYKYEYKYVLLKGNSSLQVNNSYAIIGTVTGTENITYKNETMSVPVVQVEQAQ